MNPSLFHLYESDVSLTDFALTVECTILTIWLWIRSRKLGTTPDKWFMLLFLSSGAASFAGGMVHGFWPPHAQTDSLLWSFTLLSLGASGVSCWNLGARFFQLSAYSRNFIATTTLLLFGFYGIYVISAPRKFEVAILAYLPAVLFLTGSVARQFLLSKSRQSSLGLWALALTFVAAFIQQGKIEIGPVGHNALYHLVQGFALFQFAVFAARVDKDRTSGGAAASSP